MAQQHSLSQSTQLSRSTGTYMGTHSFASDNSHFIMEQVHSGQTPSRKLEPLFPTQNRNQPSFGRSSFQWQFSESNKGSPCNKSEGNSNIFSRSQLSQHQNTKYATSERKQDNYYLHNSPSNRYLYSSQQLPYSPLNSPEKNKYSNNQLNGNSSLSASYSPYSSNKLDSSAIDPIISVDIQRIIKKWNPQTQTQEQFNSDYKTSKYIYQGNNKLDKLIQEAKQLLKTQQRSILTRTNENQNILNNVENNGISCENTSIPSLLKSFYGTDKEIKKISGQGNDDNSKASASQESYESRSAIKVFVQQPNVQQENDLKQLETQNEMKQTSLEEKQQSNVLTFPEVGSAKQQTDKEHISNELTPKHDINEYNQDQVIQTVETKPFLISSPQADSSSPKKTIEQSPQQKQFSLKQILNLPAEKVKGNQGYQQQQSNKLDSKQQQQQQQKYPTLPHKETAVDPPVVLKSTVQPKSDRMPKNIVIGVIILLLSFLIFFFIY